MMELTLSGDRAEQKTAWRAFAEASSKPRIEKSKEISPLLFFGTVERVSQLLLAVAAAAARALGWLRS